MINDPERLLPAPPIDYSSLVLHADTQDLHLGGLVTQAPLELSMDGTATVTMTLAEEEPGQLRDVFTGFFKPDATGRRRLDPDRFDSLQVLGSMYILREINRTARDAWDLVSYDRVSEILKTYTGALKVSRGKKTRPEFVGMLAAEAAVRALIPDRHARPFIQQLAPADIKALNAASAAQSDSKILTQAGTPATWDEASWARALLNALGFPVTRGGLQLIIGWEHAEGGNWHNKARYNPLNTTEPMPGAGNTGSQGNIKVYTSWQQGLQATVKTLRNGHYDLILKHVRAGDWKQGMVAIGLSVWGTSPGLIQSTVPAAAGEAGKEFKHPSLSSPSQSGAGTVEKAWVQRFEFARGKRENSWDCSKRLGDEIRFNRYAVFNTLVYASDPQLARDNSPYEFDELDEWVDQATWTCTARQRIDEIQITGRLAAIIPPGAAVVVGDDSLPTYGTWLVRNFKRDLLDPECRVEVTLGRPRQPLLEPRSTVRTSSSSSGSSSLSGPLRDRIVAEAKKTLTSVTGYNYYWQGTLLTKDPTPPEHHPYRSDCSQWIRAIYLAAGAPDPGLNTSDMEAKSHRTRTPKPGDLVLMHGHVELYVGDGRTIGHGDAKIDYSTAAYYIANRGAWYATYDFLK